MEELNKMFDYIKDGKNVEASDMFDTIMKEKLASVLADKQIEIAKSTYSGVDIDFRNEE